ncbi:MAG: phage virion morphogenesis protein [Halomonas sp.]|nr:phage virion morphogenesis protein [Halomonas sp.]
MYRNPHGHSAQKIGYVDRAIQDLIHKGNDFTAPMKSFNEGMVNRTQQRFREKEAPDSSAWPPNSSVTEKRKGHGRVLKGKQRAGQAVQLFSHWRQR